MFIDLLCCVCVEVLFCLSSASTHQRCYEAANDQMSRAGEQQRQHISQTTTRHIAQLEKENTKKYREHGIWLFAWRCNVRGDGLQEERRVGHRALLLCIVTVCVCMFA